MIDQMRSPEIDEDLRMIGLFQRTVESLAREVAITSQGTIHLDHKKRCGIILDIAQKLSGHSETLISVLDETLVSEAPEDSPVYQNTQSMREWLKTEILPPQASTQ